jgi:hypothetical protein
MRIPVPREREAVRWFFRLFFEYLIVHSYDLEGRSENVLATTPYCRGFASVLRLGRVFGV